jgi:heat shock protein HtpX
MNQLKTIFLLGVMSAILVGIGAWISPGAVWIFGALAIVMNIGAYWFSDKIVLRMSGAREVSSVDEPWLHRTVADLASRAGIPAPRVYITEEMQPNAFATGRNPAHGAVAVTRGILQILEPRELRGVLAHEIAHIANRDILIASIAATMASAVSSIASIVQWSAIFGGRHDDEEEGSGAGGLLLAFIAPIAATLVQLGISRSREFIADETGARLTGDPEALALALLKLQRGAEMIPSNASPATASLFIVNPLAGLGQRMVSLFSTHPATEARVERLRNLAQEIATAAPAMQPMAR